MADIFEQDIQSLKQPTPSNKQPKDIFEEDMQQIDVMEYKERSAQDAPVEQDSYWDVLTDRAIALGDSAFKGFLDTAGGIAQKASNVTSKAFEALGGLPGGVDVSQQDSPNMLQATRDWSNKRAAQAEETYPTQSMLGELGGAIAGTAPLSPVLGMVAKAPALSSKLAPYGLKTAAKYATGATGGSASAGLIGGLEYNDENPESLFNMQRSLEMANNPLAPALGMAGAKLSGLGQKSQQLAQKEKAAFGAKMFNRDLTPGTKHQSVTNTIFDNLPLVGTYGSRLRQTGTFPKATERFIKTLAKDAVTKGKGNVLLEQGARKAVNKAAYRLNIQEQKMWAPIANSAKKIKLTGNFKQEIKKRAGDLVDEYGEEIKSEAPGIVAAIQRRFLKTKGLNTFDDLKSAKTDLMSKLYGKKSGFISGEAGRRTREFVRKLYDNLDDTISKHDPSLLSKYKAANRFTYRKHQLLDNADDSLAKAIQNEGNLYKFTDRLLKEKSPTALQRTLKPFKQNELPDIRAGIMGKHLKDSLDPDTGNFDVAKFLKLTSKETNTPEIMGPTYKALQGLREVMQSNKMSPAVTPPQGVQGTAVKGIQGATGLITGASAFYNPAMTGGVVATTKALALISANSPVKRALIAVSRAKNNPKLAAHLADKAHKMLLRANVKLRLDDDEQMVLDVQDNRGQE